MTLHGQPDTLRLQQVFIYSWHWDPASADFTAFCDACPAGLGFWYPSLNLSFFLLTPGAPDASLIFYFFKALCVLCALQDITSRFLCAMKVVIYIHG